MAKKPTQPAKRTIPQDYPRIQDASDEFYGMLDETKLIAHPNPTPITPQLLKQLIEGAIRLANEKSSRDVLSLPPEATLEEKQAVFLREGKKLFSYLHDYPIDPAATAHDYHGKHYRQVGLELFRNRTLQKGRMNSGWRYQFLAAGCAEQSRRFRSVSGIGMSQGDFTATIEFRDGGGKMLHLYVSVKNRTDTLGGQDWPNAIAALESVAKTDNNKTGPYCCVFGIAMDRGLRRIPRSKKTGDAYSPNSEVWKSDFFWPFFSAYSYEAIMNAVLEVLVDAANSSETLPTMVDAPPEVLEVFGTACAKAGLIDEQGNFHDPFRLVRFFCSTATPPKAGKKSEGKEQP